MKPDTNLDLETLLAQREAPASQPDLVKNILKQAHLTPQKVPFWQEVTLLLRSYLAVKPVPLMGVLLTVGFLLGTVFENENTPPFVNNMAAAQTSAMADSYYGYNL